MNIAFICHKYPPYVNAGLAPYAKRVINNMVNANQNIWLFTMNFPYDFPVIEGEKPLTIIRPPVRQFLKKRHLSEKTGFSIKGKIIFILNILLFNIKTYFKIYKLNKIHKFEVICLHEWQSSPVGILCALTLRVPVIFHIHSTEISMTPWGKAMDPLKIVALSEHILGRLAARVIVPTEEMKTLLIKNRWIPDKIKIVHHGYEDEAFSNIDTKKKHLISTHLKKLRKQLNITENDQVLLFVGRLSYVKGILTLIKAMKKITSKKNNIKLLLLGIGFPGSNEDEVVKNLINELNLGEFIYAYYRYLEGEDVLRHYLLADLCIFPSLYEPFGLVAVEAMALGKPVILGTGFAKVFAGSKDLKTAVYLEKDNPDLLADKVLNILANPKEAKKMGRNAQKFVKEHFRWDRTVRQTLSVYKESIQKNGKNIKLKKYSV